MWVLWIAVVFTRTVLNQASWLFSSFITIQNDSECFLSAEKHLYTYSPNNTLSFIMACLLLVLHCGVKVLIVPGDRVLDINHFKGGFVILGQGQF